MGCVKETCALCGREAELDHTNRHHLIPKSKGGKETERMCKVCHKQLHILFTNKELENEYSTIEALHSHEKVQKWIKWTKKHPDFFGRLKGTTHYS